jgi:hypothetical protein
MDEYEWNQEPRKKVINAAMEAIGLQTIQP